jgi:hypothetical protein
LGMVNWHKLQAGQWGIRVIANKSNKTPLLILI